MGQHYRQEGVGGSGIRLCLGERHFAEGVAVGGRVGQRAGAPGRAVALEAVKKGGSGAILANEGVVIPDSVGDVHRKEDKLRLVGQPARGDHGQQGVQEQGIEVGPVPLRGSAGPVGQAQHILRRDMPLLAVVISQLYRVSAILVDNDDHIQTAATRPDPHPKRANQKQAGEPTTGSVHRLILAHAGVAVNGPHGTAGHLPHRGGLTGSG